MTDEELELIKKYKRLSPYGRRIALAQITALTESEEITQKQSGSLSAEGGHQGRILAGGIQCI